VTFGRRFLAVLADVNRASCCRAVSVLAVATAFPVPVVFDSAPHRRFPPTCSCASSFSLLTHDRAPPTTCPTPTSLRYSYFEEEEIDANAWIPSWLRFLLARELHLNSVLRLWDTYFSCQESLELHTYVCLGKYDDGRKCIMLLFPSALSRSGSVFLVETGSPLQFRS